MVIYFVSKTIKFIILHVRKERLPVKNDISYFSFIKYSEIIWNKRDANGSCVPVFIIDMGWYLWVIGRLHNDETLVYLFTGEVIDGTPNISSERQDVSWFQQLRYQFLPILINTTSDGVHFFESVERKISKKWKNEQRISQ